jgi:REG-2-like HAD superfamily hydrolase
LKPELITFDCAGTLLDVNWNPGEFAVTCAHHCGLDLDPTASDRFGSMLRDRHRDYLKLNLARDHRRCEVFWDQLTADWLDEMRVDSGFWLGHIRAASKYLGFGPKSTIFKVFDDVMPCLRKLRSHNVPTAVISNWDYSLHEILEVMGLTPYFELVIASLEEGIEKPDPRVFELTLRQFGVDAAKAVHVGDDPLDDLRGARQVGMRAILVDRNLPAPMAPPYIRSLSELYGALRWSN